MTPRVSDERLAELKKQLHQWHDTLSMGPSSIKEYYDVVSGMLDCRAALEAAEVQEKDLTSKLADAMRANQHMGREYYKLEAALKAAEDTEQELIRSGIILGLEVAQLEGALADAELERDEARRRFEEQLAEWAAKAIVRANERDAAISRAEKAEAHVTELRHAGQNIIGKLLQFAPPHLHGGHLARWQSAIANREDAIASSKVSTPASGDAATG